MRITIVMGFFLPVPPLAGGATEKSWYRLAQYFADQGHEITMVSREWPGLSESDSTPGIHHLRIPGMDHDGSLRQNLWRDLRWSCRVFRRLPPADILVVNAVTLPVWVARLKPSAGRLVIMTGRVPKGQYRWYGNVRLALAASTAIKEAVVRENARLDSVTSVWGYPLDHQKLSNGPTGSPEGGPVTIGYIGRIHLEKGLDLLAAAIEILAKSPDLPRWRVLIVGPHDVARGGSGEAYQKQIEERMKGAITNRLEWHGPEFDPAKLVAHYQSIDIFCLPSLSENGETFGVAAAEAGAAGAVPVVSELPCFRDFVEDGVSGIHFDHRSAQAAEALAAALKGLIRSPQKMHDLASQAQHTTRRYDFEVYGGRLLEAFTRLITD